MNTWLRFTVAGNMFNMKASLRNTQYYTAGTDVQLSNTQRTHCISTATLVM
jgi:hypothetical protein